VGCALVTRGASRLQHDTLDQIIEAALCKLWEREPGSQVTREAAWAVRDALLAEGRIHAPDENSVTQWQPFLAIPLLVGVGCGNAKKGAT
jgi:hypothetical protein